MEDDKQYKLACILLVALCLYLAYPFVKPFFDEQTLLDDLNRNGANIDIEDKYFRIRIYSPTKLLYTSENMSWIDLENHGFIKNGQLTHDNTFWRYYCIKKASIEHGIAVPVKVQLQGYI